MTIPIFVLPLKMVVFQSALLIVAIAVEAAVLRRELSLLPRTSIQYATTINLLSTLVGWLMFFGLQPIASPSIRQEMINCIFFDRWQRGFIPWVFLAAVLTFFVSFFVKFGGLVGLKYFLGELENMPDPMEEQPNRRQLYVRRDQMAEEPGLEDNHPLVRNGNAVLRSNAASYTVISIILLLRFLAQGSITSFAIGWGLP